METKSKRSERMIVLIISLVLIVVLTFVFSNMQKKHLYLNRDRLIILCYQTNILGSDGTEWALKLKNSFPDIPDFEVSVYETKQVGNESITITSENGWAQVVIRLAARQGDVLLVNNEAFYSTLMENDMLLPIEGSFENVVTDSTGTVYGIDVTGLTAEGLLNLNTSKYVGFGQPLPIMSTEDTKYEYKGNKYSPRVIAVIYKGTSRYDQAQSLLNSLFGKEQ